MRYFFHAVSSPRSLAVLIWCLALFQACASLWAQGPSSPELRIVIIDGDGAINNIRKRTAREPIVEVQDQNNRPIAGAAVTFQLPNDGPGGVFSGGSKTSTVITDANGRAIARGFQPNKLTGKFQIQVDASLHGYAPASAAVAQTNVAAVAAGAAVGAGVSAKVIVVLVAVGAAAAGGTAVALTAKGKSNPSTPPAPGTTISAGGTTVGHP